MSTRATRTSSNPKVKPHAARTLMWIAAAAFGFVWVLTFFILKLRGSYMHCFLVVAIGIVIMNLVAHYWTQPEADDGQPGQGEITG